MTLGQRRKECADDMPVHEEAHHRTERERAECDERACAQLAEVIDERRLFRVAEPAWQPHGYDGSSSSFRPLTESLNSRIPLPRLRPISGRRFGPNTSSAT